MKRIYESGAAWRDAQMVCEWSEDDKKGKIMIIIAGGRKLLNLLCGTWLDWFYWRKFNSPPWERDGL